MKTKIISFYYVVIILFTVCMILSCEKNELDSERDAAIIDNNPPSISNVSISKSNVFRGDSIDITFTAADDKGIYFLKVEYSPWNLVKFVTLDGSKKEFTYTVRIGVSNTATFKQHAMKLGVIDIGFNDASTLQTVTVDRKPNVYTQMFVYGDIILAGSLGKGWDYKYAEPMALQSDGTLNLDVYNYKPSCEFLFISSRNSTAEIIGLSGIGHISNTHSTKVTLPQTIGYYRISFNPDVMTYTISTISQTATVLKMWLYGEGLVETGGYDWDINHTIPMSLFNSANPNIYVADITRNNSATGKIKALKSTSVNGEIGWISEFDVDNIGNNNFNLSTATGKHNAVINGGSGSKYKVKIDIQLNKGVVVSNP